MPEQPENAPSVEQCVETLRVERDCLWGDLADAYRRSLATPPEGSIECLNLIARIQTITELVGPTPTGRIGMPFLLAGVYERVHADIGITASVPGEDLEMAREYVAEQQRAAGLSV